MDADVAGPTTAIPELDGTPAGELVIVNDDDLSYAFIELDPDSLNVATDNITAIADPMPRSLIWSAAWNMTRNAQTKARDFVALVARGAVAETDMAVLERDIFTIPPDEIKDVRVDMTVLDGRIVWQRPGCSL